MNASAARHLVVDVDVGGVIEVVVPPESSAGVVSFVLLSKSGRRARLQITAPDEIGIERSTSQKRQQDSVDFSKNR